MRTFLRIAASTLVLCVLAALIGCPTTPKPPQIEAINNSDVFRMAQDALQPVVDQYIDRGDRILLANVPAFDGTEAWRFVPTPLEVKQTDYEETILPNARKIFTASGDDSSGGIPELQLLNDLFELDGANSVYKLKTGSDKYDELLLGRTLAGTGYSGLGRFVLADFAHANPYFIDSFESGLLASVLKKQGKGFERLWPAAMDTSDLPASAVKRLADHKSGKLVFNTNMLSFNTWSDIQDTYKPNPIAKVLMYSISNVVASGMDYIGIQVSFRLIDVTRGGKLLWSGSKTLTSPKFPREKVPFVGTVRLTIPPQVASQQRDVLARTLREQGVKSMSAVLMKIDDIPVFGSYPVTREDFAVESALEQFFASLSVSPGQNVTVMEKLYPRQYKEPWQLAHAVHYVSPLLGGDYSQFRSYYGAQYMIGYRVMWKKLQGVQLLQGDKDVELAGKILGIYVKVMDMADGGRVVLSDYLTFGTDAELDDNVLYRCYARTKGFAGLAAALRGSGVVTDSTHTSLINRRMEIANNYIGEKTASEDFILNRLPQGKDQSALMMAYYKAYEVLRTFGKKPEASKEEKEEQETWSASQELNATMAVNLMQSWFEDGLCTALVAGDAAPNEKMESLYSRYLLQKSVRLADTAVDIPEEMLYLSPLLLSRWGSTAPLKSYYGIDKIIYFSLLETATPASPYIRPPSSSPIARFFPFVSYDPDSLQVSVVNVVSGDYELKQDFPLK
jgi:hypothetical protein